MKKLLIILACFSLIFMASNSLIASGGGGGGGGGDGSAAKDQPSFYGPGKPYPTKEAAEKAAEEETRQTDQNVRQGSWFIKGCFIEAAGQDGLIAAGPSSENETKGGANPDRKGNYSPGKDSPTGTCTSFTYSAWTVCTGGFKTRTITSRLPVNCTGGSPNFLKQPCTPPPVKKGTAQ